MNTVQKEDIIDFVRVKARFAEFLKSSSNRQLLFSGPFGSGKTTFLKNFFKGNEDYETIHIFPINYSLHTNLDVYEILKYDIILELISKGAFTEDDLSNVLKYTYAISQSADRAVGKLVSIFSQTGKGIKEAVDLLGDAYEHSAEEFARLSDPLLGIKAFGKTIEKVKVYEYEDYISSLIKEKLQALFSKEQKQNVLIVDDLDRIDPEHLFRIISLFSAHIDHHTDENKFGFDKIIFVGDIQNIKGMFLHKYGFRNNFNAFLSKLSTRPPFLFDPEKELYNQIESITEPFSIRSDDHPQITPIYQILSASGKRFFKYIMCSLIYSGSISLRDIQKSKNSAIIIKVNEIIRELNIPHYECEMYIILMVLKQFIPSFLDITKSIADLQSLPLSLETTFNHNSRRTNNLIQELSHVPLATLFYKEILNYRISETHNMHEIVLEGEKVKINIEQEGRMLVCTLHDDYSTEVHLLRVSRAAFERLIFLL